MDPKAPGAGQRACALERNELNAKFFHGLDGGGLNTRVTVGGNASEIECELMFCF